MIVIKRKIWELKKTVSELADILGVSRQAVNNRVKSLPEEDLDKMKKALLWLSAVVLLSWKRSIKNNF